MAVRLASLDPDIYDLDDTVVEESTNIKEEINFIETDAQVVSEDLISSFEDFSGQRLYDGDERKIFLQGFAYVLIDIMNYINETGRQNLLEYASDTRLDALGDLYGNARLQATKAKTTIKFSIVISPTDHDIIVPKGTRVTTDGKIFFATDKSITFPIKTSTLSQTVSATATEAGSSYNNIGIGELNKLVDGVEFIQSVENTTITSGGSDVETDEEYKERLKLSPFAFSVAGPSNAYKMIALAVSQDIQDVSVYSPSAGVVEIAVVKDGGVIPESEDTILDEVLEACSAKDRRPLTDKVQVVPATASNTSVNVKYFVANDDTSVIAAVTQAVEEYKKWQTEKIGRDINPDQLKKMMMDAGAARIDITAPVYTQLTDKQIAQFTSTSVTYGGSITV